MKYTCINTAYSEFVNKFSKAINSVAPTKKVRVTTNSKLCFDPEKILMIQKRDKLYSEYKKSGLETDKDQSKRNHFFKRRYTERKALIWTKNKFKKPKNLKSYGKFLSVLV